MKKGGANLLYILHSTYKYIRVHVDIPIRNQVKGVKIPRGSLPIGMADAW